MSEQLAVLQKAVQSRHDYGPASPGEQEAAWVAYCARSGWNPNNHPSAKNAYLEGFCDGDSYSEGDEGREVLRQEVGRKDKQIVELKESYLRKMTEKTQLTAENAALREELTRRKRESE